MKKKRDYAIDAPLPRPKTIREAKAMIEQIFKENRWDKREQKIYYRQIGINPDASDTPGAVRAIIKDLEQSKMLLLIDE